MRKDIDNLLLLTSPLKPICQLLLLLFVLSPLCRAQNLADSDGRSGGVAIEHVDVLRDPGGELTVEDVASPAHASAFAPASGDLALGFTHDAVWLRFQVGMPAKGPRRWLLETAPPLLEEVQLYTPRTAGPQAGGFDIQTEGISAPSANRAVANRNFIFSLPHDQAGLHTYYMRVRSSSSLQVRLRIWQGSGLMQAVGRDNALYGAGLGMAVLMIGFNLIFWYWLRDRLYLAYAGYVLFSGLSFAFVTGYGPEMLGDLPINAALIQRALLLGQYAVSGLFFGSLLRLRQTFPTLDRYNRALSLCWLVASIGVGTGMVPYMGQFTGPLGLAQSTVLEVIAAWLIWQGRRELTVYLFAFLALYFSNIATTTRAMGWVPNVQLIDYLPLLAAALHMILVNIGLAQRARLAEDARRAAEHVTLSMSLQNERELEARVIQRTRALEDANLALQREVAERTELQSQLRNALAAEREAMTAQRQFVAMVSHEFRTPLAIIDATAQRVLLQHPMEADTLAGPLGKIRRAVQRLNGLIDTFLGEERNPSQGHEVARETLDLRNLATTCGDQHRPLSSGLIDCQTPDEPVRVIGDGGLLSLVLSSMVDNALKYSPAGSPVTLRVGGNAERGWVDIVDYGAGISPADRERIFDKHVRLGVVAGVAGTGLGLFIARNAARRMGGDIEIDSEPGRGSCFRLWLPRVAG